MEFEDDSFGTNIKILGVGGAGCNALNTMIENTLQDVEFIAANTNVLDLKRSNAKNRIQLGKLQTKGLGTGANPELGKLSAEESLEEIKAALDGADMLFIAAGMGGGTGTGGAPVIAKAAKEMDILTIAIVTKPFESEGQKRKRNAEQGIEELETNVDTIIVIPNEKIKDLYSDLTVKSAFKKADNILFEAAKALSDIIRDSGFISADFADVKTIMKDKGYALMGTGIGEGDNRAVEAAKQAMSNPLLSELSLKNANGLLINITATEEVKMSEFEQISKAIVDEAGDNGDIILGIIFNPEMEERIKVTLIATGLKKIRSKEKEIERIRTAEPDKEEDISDMLDRIRKAKKSGIGKDLPNDEQDQNVRPKMDVPTFMRRNPK